jgi:hypothetical protein
MTVDAEVAADATISIFGKLMVTEQSNFAADGVCGTGMYRTSVRLPSNDGSWNSAVIMLGAHAMCSWIDNMCCK